MPLKGHNFGGIPCRKCGKVHIAWDRRGEKNPFFGKTHTESARQKLRDSRIGKPSNGGVTHPNSTSFVKGCIPWNKGLTKETDARVKNNAEQLRLSEKFQLARYNQKFATIALKDTSIEIKLRTALEQYGIAFVANPFIACYPDILIDRIAIFCDGCYWHNCPFHFPNGPGRNNEERKRRQLEDLGYKVLRFWEHDINNDTSGCVSMIVEKIRQ